MTRNTVWTQDGIRLWLQAFHNEHGYTPGGRVRKEHRGPSNEALIRQYGTVTNAYTAAGLPNARRSPDTLKKTSTAATLKQRQRQNTIDYLTRQTPLTVTCQHCPWGPHTGPPLEMLAKQKHHRRTHR